MGQKGKVPDCLWGPWDPIRTTDCYFDPKTGKQVFIKLTADTSKEKMKRRDELLPFWFAKAQRFQNRENATFHCVVIRPFNGEPAVQMWGPEGRDDDWTHAVRFRGAWYILDTSEAWEFNFILNEKADKLTGVNVFLNGKKVAECH